MRETEDRRVWEKREEREGGVDYAAACCHALCCLVLWIIYLLFEAFDLSQWFHVFVASRSCFNHSYSYTYIYRYKNIYVYMYIYRYMYVCIYKNINTCVCVCVCVCLFVCVCVCLLRAVVLIVCYPWEEGPEAKRANSQLVPSNVSLRITGIQQFYEGWPMSGGIGNVLFSTCSQTKNG